MSTPPTAARSNLGIYIQVPFCASKCSFCNFSSRVERSTVFDQYTRMLERELEGWQSSFRRPWHPPRSSLPSGRFDLHRRRHPYFAGRGTPGSCRRAPCGITCAGARTSNSRWKRLPAQQTRVCLCAFRGLGMNRLSIGAQTFDDHELRAVGRLHSADDTVELVHQARQAGFQNISLDLIAGLAPPDGGVVSPQPGGHGEAAAGARVALPF